MTALDACIGAEESSIKNQLRGQAGETSISESPVDAWLFRG